MNLLGFRGLGASAPTSYVPHSWASQSRTLTYMGVPLISSWEQKEQGLWSTGAVQQIFSERLLWAVRRGLSGEHVLALMERSFYYVWMDGEVK